MQSSSMQCISISLIPQIFRYFAFLEENIPSLPILYLYMSYAYLLNQNALLQLSRKLSIQPQQSIYFFWFSETFLQPGFHLELTYRLKPLPFIRIPFVYGRNLVLCIVYEHTQNSIMSIIFNALVESSLCTFVIHVCFNYIKPITNSYH